jgi:hypothetical protein
VFSIKLISVARGLPVLGGLSKALALPMEKFSFVRLDEGFAEQASCNHVPVTMNAAMSHIVVKRMVNMLSLLFIYS